MAAETLTVVADRGYFEGEEILACERADISPLGPKPQTSNAKAEGRYGRNAFVYDTETDTYRCPAGEQLTRRFTAPEDGTIKHVYFTSQCGGCAQKTRCTTGKERRLKRWEHEAVLEAMQHRLDARPEAMWLRRATVEHAFGTLKQWMGGGHLLIKGLKGVSAEMSLEVLAYNIKRTIGLVGVQPVMAAIRS